MTAYEDALQKANEATKVFRGVQKAYRARKIGDEEYLAARKIYEAAEKEFERSYLAVVRL